MLTRTDTLETDLFEPFALGPITLANRVVMAPLTRARAGAGDVPTAMNAAYYAQRASAGLIISEASPVSAQGKGFAWTPGIHTPEQVAGWREVTEAVHAKGGHIYCQLWHVGRISHPSLQPGGVLPVAPSAVQPNGKAFTEAGFQPIPTPRALALEELPGIVEQFRHAAGCAKAAGFDGVEIHGANGYLLDQFHRDRTNLRTDRYGGPIANRVRLTLEVTEAVCSVFGADRVGIRLAPLSTVNDISDSNPEALFTHLVAELNRFRLAYLHLVEGITRGPREVEGGFDLAKLRRLFQGVYMANNGYTRELALAARQHNTADLIAFGRPFIANPDLVERLRRNAPLNTPDTETFYGGAEHGYLDYPALASEQ